MHVNSQRFQGDQLTKQLTDIYHNSAHPTVKTVNNNLNREIKYQNIFLIAPHSSSRRSLLACVTTSMSQCSGVSDERRKWHMTLTFDLESWNWRERTQKGRERKSGKWGGYWWWESWKGITITRNWHSRS